MQIIIDTSGTSISVRNKCFLIKNETNQKMISPSRISSFAIMTNCNINSSAIKLAVQNQVGIMFFNRYGNIQARMYSPYFTNLSGLRKKQLVFSMIPDAASWVVDLLIQKNIEQISTLQQLKQRKPVTFKHIDLTIDQMNKQSSKLNDLRNERIGTVRNNIMGIEGSISKLYFSTISPNLPEKFRFERRSRRPAMDYFNAGLNYLYGMTYSVVESGIFAKGLDPSIGILHVDQYGRPTLAYDLIEPFRPLMDRLLIDMVFDEVIDESHFIKKDEGYWVSKTGKRIIISTFQKYLQKRLKYRNKVKRLKDHIYETSNHLGKIVETKINLEDVSDLL